MIKWFWSNNLPAEQITYSKSSSNTNYEYVARLFHRCYPSSLAEFVATIFSENFHLNLPEGFRKAFLNCNFCCMDLERKIPQKMFLSTYNISHQRTLGDLQFIFFTTFKSLTHFFSLKHFPVKCTMRFQFPVTVSSPLCSLSVTLSTLYTPSCVVSAVLRSSPD